MKRRNFLKGILGLAAVPAVGVVVAKAPAVVGIDMANGSSITGLMTGRIDCIEGLKVCGDGEINDIIEWCPEAVIKNRIAAVRKIIDEKPLPWKIWQGEDGAMSRHCYINDSVVIERIEPYKIYPCPDSTGMKSLFGKSIVDKPEHKRAQRDLNRAMRSVIDDMVIGNA
ncbi:MAG TPA: hypothetical protein ENJ35_04260 [Gammaproteobacteria bacterium]|nr:hypothetical protein [Gammaproteobacteria bacterium]